MHAFVRFGLAAASLGALIVAPVSVADAATPKVTVVNLRGPLVNATFSVLDPSEPALIPAAAG